LGPAEKGPLKLRSRSEHAAARLSAAGKLAIVRFKALITGCNVMAAPDYIRPSIRISPGMRRSCRIPSRTTEHEKYILDVVMRFKNAAEFRNMPKPTGRNAMKHSGGLDELQKMPSDPILDQDDRVLALGIDHRGLSRALGQMGCYLCRANSRSGETIENQRVSPRIYSRIPSGAAGIARLFAKAGHLAATRRSTKYNPDSVPRASSGTPNGGRQLANKWNGARLARLLFDGEILENARDRGKLPRFFFQKPNSINSRTNTGSNKPGARI